MRRAIFILMLGMFCTALFTSAVSVYVFHDVDKTEIGHWNSAFVSLCLEFILFTVIIGCGVALLVFLGRKLLHLQGHAPNPSFVLILGVVVSIFQYPWDMIGRFLFPELADFSLASYLLLAIILCAAAILRNCLKQRKLRGF